jgi:uncharacterized protein YjiS (DUF1127 family)
MASGTKAMKRLLHYWENRQKRRALAQLRSLNPRILRDIGIDRSELTSIVYGDSKGRRRRCTENLAAPWAGRRRCDSPERADR